MAQMQPAVERQANHDKWGNLTDLRQFIFWLLLIRSKSLHNNLRVYFCGNKIFDLCCSSNVVVHLY